MHGPGPSTALRPIIEYARKSLTYTPFEVRWIPASSRLVVAGSYPKCASPLRPLLSEPMAIFFLLGFHNLVFFCFK